MSARLVEELWDEVSRELEQRPFSVAERRLLDQRIRQHKEFPADVHRGRVLRDHVERAERTEPFRAGQTDSAAKAVPDLTHLARPGYFFVRTQRSTR